MDTFGDLRDRSKVRQPWRARDAARSAAAVGDATCPFGVCVCGGGVWQETEEDMNNKCFICQIGREEFDRNADGFELHIKIDHNMWAYA